MRWKIKNLDFFLEEEIMKDGGRERDVIELEDNTDPTEKSHGVES